jgi:hypothetical protein
MFQNIIESLEKIEELERDTIHNLRLVESYLTSITSQTEEKFRRIKDKYNLNNRRHIFPDPTIDTHLEFWRGSGDYNVGVCVADKTGVHDNDKEFGLIINEWPYDNFLIIDSDIEQGKFFKIADNIFYTWISYLWQTIDGHETQLSVKIIENNSSSTFSLNDFAWYDLSKFIDFHESIKPRRKYFNRDLGLAEIYSRVDMKYKFLKTPENTRLFSKNGEFREVKLNEGFTFIDNVRVGQDSIESMDSYSEIKNRQIIYVDVINNLLNNEWIDVTFQHA